MVMSLFSVTWQEVVSDIMVCSLLGAAVLDYLNGCLYHNTISYLYRYYFFIQVKKEHPEEAIHNEVVGQAHMENYALKVFLYADNEDRAGRFTKWVNH